jgi:cytoskeletal protein CcmA (bactofilin family)
MWNKRDEAPSGSPANRTLQSEPVRQTAAAPPPQVETSTPSVLSSAAAIGTSMIIKGDIFSREELYVDGEVEGKLELQHRLTIGPRGKVKAQIRAREVVIAGNVQGNVEVSEKITIQRNASLIGDIKAAGIVIDDGAYFKGSIDIVKSPPIKKPEPAKVESAKVEPQKAESARVETGKVAQASA